MEKQLICKLPSGTMDILLKIRIKLGEHTFWEDVYTHSQKYHMWNDQHKPFRSLKKGVAHILFEKGDQTQKIVGKLFQTA